MLYKAKQKLNVNSIECNEVVDKWNEMINTLCDARRKTILDINDVLQM